MIMEGILNPQDSSWLAQQLYNYYVGGRVNAVIEQLKPKIYPDGDQWCCLYGSKGSEPGK
jgi:hypothetical protein